MVKKSLRKIPATDLARIAPLPRNVKKLELKKFDLFKPRKSYRVVRKILPWLYALDLPLFSLPQEGWERIETEIRSRAKADFVDSCLEVAQLIWKLNLSRKTVAAPFLPPPFYIGPGHNVQFGVQHICEISGRLLFPFVQMRRKHALDMTGLGILASMMREAYVFGDFENAGIEIIDLSIPRRMNARQVRIYYADDLPKFSLLDLNEMVLEVFAVIAEIEDEEGEP